jgi:hypothetical protein
MMWMGVNGQRGIYVFGMRKLGNVSPSTLNSTQENIMGWRLIVRY